MSDLVAISYEDETAAYRAGEELGRCCEELLVDPDASSVLVCGRDGSRLLTIGRRAGGTAHWSKFWGVLVGTLLGDEDSAVIDLTFRKQLRARLRPGTSVLLVATPGVDRHRVLVALSHFGGRAFSCRLADDLPG
ncbi:MAG: DUF1269 domain-containing protein [Actinobacteria bacterium]|nr:DUF1269 domain-containing protein [Actinomycetota bacterium]